jgi:Glycosyltransferase family 87
MNGRRAPSNSVVNSVQPIGGMRAAGLLLRGALLLNVGLGLSYVALWGMLAWQGLFWRADFSAYYTGWSIARDGLGEQLYDFDLQTRYQQQILGGRSFSQGLLPYLNPPHATIPFVPLALLPLPAAFAIWTLCQIALLVWMLRLLLRIARDWEPQERWLMVSAVVAFPPLLFTLQLGAFSLLMLLCMLQFYWSLKQGHDRAAGLWLLLGTVKPQVMLLPGALLIGARRWHALGVALLGGGALAALSGALLGWRSWAGFLDALRIVSGYFGIFGIVPTTMYNFKGTLALILGNDYGEAINQASLVALALVVALTLLLWRVPWRPDEPVFDLRMALTILLGLLFNPHLHRQDGVMFIAPAVLFYVYLRQRGLPRRAFAVWALACPLIVLVSEFTIEGSLGVRIPVVMMGLLALWMGKALVGEWRTSGPTTPAS